MWRVNLPSRVLKKHTEFMFNTAHCVSILPQADKCGVCDKNVSNDCRADCGKVWGGSSGNLGSRIWG